MSPYASPEKRRARALKRRIEEGDKPRVDSAPGTYKLRKRRDPPVSTDDPRMSPLVEGKCNFPKRDFTRCAKPAGTGTVHPAYWRCRLHGGNAPTQIIYAQRLMAADAARKFGLSRDISPTEALVEELCRTAGRVSWFDTAIRDLPDGDAMIKRYEERQMIERKHMFEVARASVALGLAERQAKFSEAFAVNIIRVLESSLSLLGVDVASTEVREVVQGQLLLVAGDMKNVTALPLGADRVSPNPGKPERFR